MAVILHFQSTGTVPGNAGPVSMVGNALTIGRGPENDLELPDPSKVVSKNHAAIEDHGGNVVIVDLSTNGTFLNYGKVPLGRVATPLNDGDILTVGPYELLVEITRARAPLGAEHLPPLDEALRPASDRPADLDDLVEAAGDGGDFLDDLLGGDAPLAGHKGVSRPEPGDDGLLPPLGEDADDPLGPAPDPHAGQGASDPQHSPSVQDAFRPQGYGVEPIPEDWGDDLLSPSPGGPGRDPFAPGPGVIPEDDDLFAPPGGTLATQKQLPEDDDLFAPSGPAQGDAGDAADQDADDGVEIPEEEMASSFGGPPPAAAPRAGGDDVPAPLRTAPDEGAAGDDPFSSVVPHRPHPTAAPPQAVSDAAARAFLQALGAGRLPVGDDELVPTLTRMGQVLGVMIRGMREVLMTRASIKSEFRIQQTRIGVGGNNPLKFSISPEQAIEAMVKPSVPGYLDATEAAEQALSDVKAHEVAMMSGMEAAMKGILAQLAPEKLEAQIQAGGGLGSLLKGRKARYWEVYEKMYAQIADQAETEFHELFAREFARAYQDQLERLK